MSETPRHADTKSCRGNGAEHQLPPPSTSVFDNLDALRLDPSASLAGTVELLTHVPVRKPLKTEFFRVHPAPSMSIACTIFEDKEERASYFVMPDAQGLLPGHLKPVLLAVCMSRQNTVFLWPVPLPHDEGSGGGFRAWGETARQAAKIAEQCWIRMQADLHLGAYRLHKAEGVLPEPAWPEKSLSELLKIAFGGKVIDSPDHPVIRKMRGLS